MSKDKILENRERLNNEAAKFIEAVKLFQEKTGGWLSKSRNGNEIVDSMYVNRPKIAKPLHEAARTFESMISTISTENNLAKAHGGKAPEDPLTILSLWRNNVGARGKDIEGNLSNFEKNLKIMGKDSREFDKSVSKEITKTIKAGKESGLFDAIKNKCYSIDKEYRSMKR